ncbi:MAG: LPS export ABC transporter ATP-binding protein [Planctomycetes bacterium]|nr:LPS export ABC transporter ATP-binding protein [Planctomycetota bacterium]MCK5578923.1 LPS export ABC transporter ATP-binding protein [Planctomycetota bacterium]
MLLKVENLVKIYSRRRVVNGVSFEIQPGEVIGLLGRNGAGKTTTFKMAVGLIMPNEGKVFLNGKDVSRLPMYQRARHGMGYLAQEPSVFQRLTVEENLLAILETIRMSHQERQAEARRLLDEYGLTKLAKQKANTLSGGEVRRLEISRSLITSPRLMLLDEPFSGVDPIAVSEIKEIIKGLRTKGIGVLLTDHNVKETLSVTDRSYIIDEGKILAQGSPEDIMNNELARRKYLGEKFTM